MKKMFTLRGVSNTGKTTKVKKVAEWIIKNYSITNNFNNLVVDFSNNDDILGVLQVNKLKIGFVSKGDDLNGVSQVDDLLNQHPDIDIIINTCRTKGEGRRHIVDNYNYAKGWYWIDIYVERYDTSDPAKELVRDTRILDELKAWLTGLEKL